jgi:hypothetical protein
MDDRGFEYRQRLGIFLFTTASRPALESTQPPTPSVPGDFSLGVKRRGREVDHSPPYGAEVKECVELYLHSPIRLLAWCLVKGTGATLPLALRSRFEKLQKSGIVIYE